MSCSSGCASVSASAAARRLGRWKRRRGIRVQTRSAPERDDAGQGEGRSEVDGELVVAGRDATEVLEAAGQARACCGWRADRPASGAGARIADIRLRANLGKRQAPR